MSTLLKSQRELKGFSQIEVAIRAGVNPSGYNRYERGVRPNQRTAERIAKALGCNIRDIFDVDLRRY
jgi:transcriptional regulator with XRE-family HTH domain